MGPAIIFDKSALQSFSIDESVWLENFFINNITPQFYIETLADLSLASKRNYSSEDVIIDLSRKTPVNGSCPNVFYHNLVIGNLLGRNVEMTGRPIMRSEIPKITPEGKIGFVYGESPETKAMNRWQNGEFYEVEKQFAKRWRDALSNLNFDSILAIVNNMVSPETKLSSLEQVKLFTTQLIKNNNRIFLNLLLDLLNIPSKFHKEIIKRWNNGKFQSIYEFSSYAAYVFTIDLFFYISMLRSYISKDRPSNKIDLAYLYYLPFCKIFVSGDNLHKRIVPLFLSEDQLFVEAKDLKKAFARLNEYYSLFPDAVKDLGAMKFAPYPPLEIDNLVSKIWDKQFRYWRKHAKEKYIEKEDVNKDKEFVKHLDKVEKESKPIEIPFDMDSDKADFVIFKRRIHVQKGKWRIVPKGLENKKS